MFGPVSDLTRRLRESRDQLTSAEESFESNKARLSKAAQESSEVEELIEQAQQQMEPDGAAQAANAENELLRLKTQLKNRQGLQASIQREVDGLRAQLKTRGEQLADAESERQFIIKLLHTQLLAVEKQQKLQATRLNTARRRFELGDGDLEDVITSEQPLAETEAKVQQLKLLLEMYNNIGNVQSPAAIASPTDPESE